MFSARLRISFAAHVITSLCVLSLIATAQNQSSVPKQAVDAVSSSGRVVAMVFKNNINAGTVRVGDTVVMEVFRPGLSNSGSAIPKGAFLFGRVVEAVGWSHTSLESRLSIVMERAEWTGGAVPLKAFVVGQASSVIPDGVMTSDNIMHEDEFSRGRPQQRRGTFPTPTLPADTELHQVTQPTSPTILVSHKSNVVLKPGMVLILRDSDAAAEAVPD